MARRIAAGATLRRLLQGGAPWMFSPTPNQGKLPSSLPHSEFLQQPREAASGQPTSRVDNCSSSKKRVRSLRVSPSLLAAGALGTTAAAWWLCGAEARPVLPPSLCPPPALCELGGAAQVVGTQTSRPTLDLPPGFLEALSAALGGDKERVVVDEEELRLHAKPWNSYHPIINLPQAVVFPRSTEEVASVVRLCGQRGIPLVAYAGGTSLEGHTTTPRRGVCLNMKLMDKVKELHADDMDVVVEPGVDWMTLNQFLAPHGLFFPLDPGPGATIGGMCATCCSGSLAVRYGTMRDNVISVQAVMADGEVIRTSSRARKSAAGYDLTRLLIGSEGTLGIITEVTLRLQNVPRFSAVAMCAFPSVRDAAKAATDTIKDGIQVSRVELLDDVMMAAINQANGYTYAVQPTLMYELIGSSEEHVQEQVRTVESVVQRNGGSNFLFSQSEHDKKELWRARKEALWAGYTLRPGTEPLITDVCVPLSRLADCIAATKEDLNKSALPCPIVAHAGDGNMHVLIFFDTENEAEVAEAKELASRMVYRALEMEGTCTGEHGVGVGKVQYLETELGVEAVKTMKQVKDALDPKGIMNPGKVLPPHLCS